MTAPFRYSLGNSVTTLSHSSIVKELHGSSTEYELMFVYILPKGAGSGNDIPSPKMIIHSLMADKTDSNSTN
ncbi:hypothetical protein GC093_32960 [Paenibacillus sp. LMG 31456]|uniref:Uncharacterized protein n=1 Tax=Paenibacillus foliorum TaxID=2654974 RepID=A0A972K5H3_9BACL|nr:hypothetical protein [Paenibacillus foliorum]